MKKQQVSAELQRIVVETLARLGRAFAERDVDAAVACFTPDGAAYGDDLGEHAHGHEELAFFLAEVFEEPFVMGWEVGEVWARHRGDVLWFVARTEAVLTYPEGIVERVPFQLSGTLSHARRHGWRFELFNGTQPVTQARELLVGV
ncbi:MAG: nuclear transport factor 2 family protein [Actinomycetota bacterium]|nr:nuclear transport factor 2 family protein [Actinomycetota bacterium]